MDNRHNQNRSRQNGKGSPYRQRQNRQSQKKPAPAAKPSLEPQAGTLLTLTDEDGMEYQYDVLASWTAIDTGKRYIIYTDHDMDLEGNEQFYAAICQIEDGSLDILPLETERDWELVEAAAQNLR